MLCQHVVQAAANVTAFLPQFDTSAQRASKLLDISRDTTAIHLTEASGSQLSALKWMILQVR